MAQELAITARGLVTTPNPAALPKDALTQALNVIIDRPGLIQSRRGFSRGMGAGSGIHKVFLANGRLWVNRGSSTATLLSYWDGSAWQTVSGTYSNATAERMRTADARNNVYATTGAGVVRIDASNGVNAAGMPKALGLDRYGPAAVLTGTGGFLTDGYQCAYRAVIGTKDASGALLLGAPSDRSVITNANGTTGWSAGVARNVVARVLLPKQNNTASTALTTSYFLQLYRSNAVLSGTTPSDEMQLVFEAYLSSTDITNGYVDVTDIQPDSLKGGYLYTSPENGDEGLTQGVSGVANNPPPTAKDVAYFADCLWYANTSGRQFLQIQILGTGSTGLAAGHTLTVGGVTYTAIAPGTPAANEFVVQTAGTATENLQATAQNLVAAINKSASNTTLWAYYISGESDAPGKILLEARTLSGSSFTAQASANGTAYLPALTSAVSSVAESFPNGIYFSRASLPEAVPPLNLLRVGPDSGSIIKIQRSRSSLFVFTDRGLYRVTGSNFSSFAVSEFDLTVILQARESVVELDGDIYAWTTQGVARINDSGIAYVSQDIDFDLRDLVLDATPATVNRYAFAVAHPAEHRYILCYPHTSASTGCAYAYVFNIRTLAWTQWRFNLSTGDLDDRSCGVFSTEDKLLYLADDNGGFDSYLYSERSAFTTADYQDAGSNGVAAGFTRAVTWAPQDGGNPALLKHWQETQLVWGSLAPQSCSLVLTGDYGGESPSISGTHAANSVTRCHVGQAAARSPRLTVQLIANNAEDGFDVAGLSVFFRPLTSRSIK